METLQDFYKRKFDWIPESVKNELGHFNVFEHDPLEVGKPKPVPYNRRAFYKVMLVVGNIDMIYADKVVEIQKQALLFSNPQIPYTCGRLEGISEGVYCVFNRQFFQASYDLGRYSMFQSAGNHVFELTDEQVEQVRPIFQKMQAELNSDYIHKYDVLRNLVFELIHFALKTQPSTNSDHQKINASQRIATLFLELLERQFPIDENHSKIGLRTASAFANQLNVHVNHLNRAVKEITQKTTTQLIANRLLQEAKAMLRNSTWNVAEIGYSLGFEEPTHFNNFFKKHTEMSPLKFRNQ